jgi:hypothetical protein
MPYTAATLDIDPFTVEQRAPGSRTTATPGDAGYWSCV